MEYVLNTVLVFLLFSLVALKDIVLSTKKFLELSFLSMALYAFLILFDYLGFPGYAIFGYCLVLVTTPFYILGDKNLIDVFNDVDELPLKASLKLVMGNHAILNIIFLTIACLLPIFYEDIEAYILWYHMLFLIVAVIRNLLEYMEIVREPEGE